ncbi:MAG: cytochrome c biogenesis protein ResB [Bdellovibrionota bacterium]
MGLKESTKKTIKRYIKALSSIKIAVIVISSIAVLTAIGTIVEAKYDATAAQKLVYRSVWMYIIMGIFATNLIAVMVDRWPWQARHSSFICAHVGILMIIVGQFVTGTYGLDGSVRVEIGKNNRFVTVPETDITIYSSFDGTNYSKMHEQEVDFFMKSPKKKPLVVQLDAPLEFFDYENYVIPSKQVQASTQPQVGSGLRFQMRNPNVNVVEWLVQRNPQTTASHDFGPASIHLGTLPVIGRNRNEMYLQPDGEKLKYAVFNTRDKKPLKTGTAKEGDLIATGWMNLEMRVLRYLPKAEETWEVTAREAPTPLTSPAVKLRYKGKEHWLLLNDTVKLFSDNSVYFVTYGNRRLDMGFPIQLKEFAIERYEGTNRPASYESIVEVPEQPPAKISMNEPLKYNGLTIYQASFQDGPGGQPIASIFSVNYDPGRWLKYLGSIVMVLGIILLFYFRKRFQRKEVQE